MDGTTNPDAGSRDLPSTDASALDALVARVKEAEAARDALAARLAEAERLAATREQQIAMVKRHMGERCEHLTARAEAAEARLAEAEARANNLAPYVKRSQRFEERVAAHPALAEAQRAAKWRAEFRSEANHWVVPDDEWVGLHSAIDAALAAADRPEPFGFGKCGNGDDEECPCDPQANEDGTATCSVCGWTGEFSAVTYDDVIGALRDFWEQADREQAAADRPDEGGNMDTTMDTTPATNALYTAWVLIANVSGGDWSQQSKEWQDAAARWRDQEFHPALDAAAADRPEGTPDALREAQDRAAAAEAHATVEAERLADELETANHFRDRLAERLEVVAVAVTELECALSFTNYANDPDHWRGHVESALEMCKRATRARADRTEGTTP